MKKGLSSPIKALRKYPLIVKYAQAGLVNFNALARLVAPRGNEGAVGMELRRYVSRLAKEKVKPFDFSKYKLQLVTRTNIHELILKKSVGNRKECLNLVNEISDTKYFISVVEGEKELVLITDKPDVRLPSGINGTLTSDLAFISIDFPIEMRETPGIYSLVTSALAGENVPIHSFHTIGGEILILVADDDLLKANETLRDLLS